MRFLFFKFIREKIDNDSKRYFVVRYVVEYDKVHYPLMLYPKKEEKTLEEYKMIVRDLQGKNKILAQRAKKSEFLEKENKGLIEKLAMMEQSSEMNKTRLSAVGREEMLEEAKNYKAEMEHMKEMHRDELRVFSDQIDMLKEQLDDREQEMSEWKFLAEKNQQNSNYEEYMPSGNASKQIETLKRKVNRLKQSENALKAKVKRLEKDLEFERKRGSSAARRRGVKRPSPNRARVRRNSALSQKSSNSRNSRNSSKKIKRKSKKSTPIRNRKNSSFEKRRKAKRTYPDPYKSDYTPRSSLGSVKSRSSKISKNSRKSRKSNKNRYSPKKKMGLPSMAERRASRERLGISK